MAEDPAVRGGRVIVTRARLRVELVPANRRWPFDVPSVKALAEPGLSFVTPVTFLVGENGSGKSTIIEALAEAYGADVRGGHIGRRYAIASQPGALGRALHLDYAPGSNARRKPKGFFLRAETAYGVFEFMSEQGVASYGPDHLLELSHGESFLQVFRAQFNEPGLYLLDEPEAALSFSSCLSLLSVLSEVSGNGGQVICATHSPLLASLPGATVLELGTDGIEPKEWEELDLVDHWRRYLADPTQYLRHLL